MMSIQDAVGSATRTGQVRGEDVVEDKSPILNQVVSQTSDLIGTMGGESRVC
jgi:hypothetical protein